MYMHFPSVCGNMIPAATVRTYVNIYMATISCDILERISNKNTYSHDIVHLHIYKPKINAEYWGFGPLCVESWKTKIIRIGKVQFNIVLANNKLLTSNGP